MGTSAPAVREHDIPISKPYKPPLALPTRDPGQWIEPMPVRQPEREPVPVRRRT